jgi:uncharacterized Tic20 family protein
MSDFNTGADPQYGQEQAAAAAGQAPPGWHPDPASGRMRWWDGQQWGPFQDEGAGAAAPAPMPASGTGGSNPRTMAMLAHVLGIFTSFLGPLIIYAMQSNDGDPFVRDQAAESLNFRICVSIVGVICAITIVGILLLPFLFIGAAVFSILGAMAANRGEWYRYPLTYRFVKPPAS